MLKEERQNLNISKIDNKIDYYYDDDDMLYLFVCIVLCIQFVKC
jgi:hypothetical protein